MDRTFKKPDAFKKNVTNGLFEIDKVNSEDFRMLHAYGHPDVFYAVKANKYFKDAECTKEFSDAEVQALELPLPIEVETARRKLIKEANDKGVLMNMSEIYAATGPTTLKHPKRIQDKLIEDNYEQKLINKINRSIAGK